MGSFWWSSVLLLLLLVSLDHSLGHSSPPFKVASASYTSLSEAIRSAGKGAVVEIAAGVHTGAENCDLVITSDLDGLSLVGIGGSQNTIVDCKGYGTRCLSVLDASVKISGISFRNGQVVVASSTSTSTTARVVHNKSNNDINNNRVRNLPRRPFKFSSSGIVVLQIQVLVTSNGKMLQRVINNNNFKMKKTSTTTTTTKFTLHNNNNNNIVNSSVSSSSSSSYLSSLGGCVLISNSASATIQDVVVQGGQAMNGGGIGIVNSKQVSISNITVISNGIHLSYSSQNLYGGGCYISNCSSVSLSSSTFSNNSIVVDAGEGYLNGGALYIASSRPSLYGPLFFTNNILNSSGTGFVYTAGAYIQNSDSPRLYGPIYSTQNSMYANGFLFTVGLQLSGCTNALLKGPIVITDNSLTVQSSGNGHCAGLQLYSTSNALMIGPIVISRNRLFTVANSIGNLYGSALEIYSSPNCTMNGPIYIEDNVMLVTGKGMLTGGAMYFRNSMNSILNGPFYVRDNTFTSLWPHITMTDPFIPPPSTSDPIHCSTKTITQTSGSFNDGSLGKYSPDMTCSWLIQLSSVVDQALASFQFRMTKLDTEQNNDFITIYNGPTSQSPLIGTYSGSLASPQCISGDCPSVITPVATAMGAMLVVFTSNSVNQFNGFEITWTTFPANKKEGNTDSLLSGNTQYPAYGIGGCAAIVSSSVIINNAYFENNIMGHAMSSHGGCIGGLSSTIVIKNSVFLSNTAKSVIAIGGAISAGSQTQVQCTNCSFSSNSAIAYGDICFYSYGIQDNMCGSAYGGSVVAVSGSVVTLMQSSMINEKTACDCPDIDCSIHGASMAISQKGSKMILSSSVIRSAKMMCFSNRNDDADFSCNWAVGGCGFVDDATVTVVNSVLEDAVIYGAGVGGGLFGTGKAVINVRNSIIRNNTARQGGGIGLEGFSEAYLYNTSLISNTALSVGGGAVVVERASISLYNSALVNNQAPKASVIFSYNEDNTATYTTQGISVTTPPGISSLMIGEINFTSAVNSWKCTWPGTVFSQDLTSEFFSLSCDRCTEGTYAIEAASSATINRTCQPCPFGALCTGSSPSSNGLLALGGYWGNADNQGGVSFYSCPLGYCCPLQEICEFDYCQGGRIGRLCGQCPAGQGLRFFTEGCGDDSTCNDAGWAGFVIVIGAVLIAIFLTFSEDTESSEILSVLVYFYQVLPLIKSSPWKRTFPALIIALQSIFTMTPSSGDSKKEGICIQKSMNAYNKLAIRMLLQGVVIMALFLVYIMHSTLKKFVNDKRIPRVSISQYLAGAVRLGVIAYITLVLVPLQMVQCIYMDEENKHVWWFDASIECYQQWQIGGFVAIAVLFPVPLLLIILLWKFWVSESGLKAKWQREVWKVLTREYRHKRRWWLGISLYRRFMLAVAFSTIYDANWRGITTIVLCLVFIVIDIRSHPFKCEMTQRAETTSLIILGILSATAAPQLSQMQFGARYGMENEDVLEVFQFILAVTPAFISVALFVYHNIYLVRRKRQHNMNSHFRKHAHGDEPLQELSETLQELPRYNLDEEWEGEHPADIAGVEYC